MGRGKTRANDDDGVRREKTKGKEKKQEREREKVSKNFVSRNYR